jgi:uncharacterized membrane protein
VETYEVYQLLHILSAIVWVGGAVMVQVFGARVGRSGDNSRLIVFMDDMLVAGRIFMFAGISTLVWGVLMVLDAPFLEFEQAWIAIGFLGVAVGAGLGAAFFAPQARKAKAQLEAGDSASAATIKRIVMVSQAELVLLLIVVWAMVAKPGL